jgi:hypothetical protein
MVVARIGSSLQIELPGGFFVCRGLERGYLPRFEDRLLLC